MPPPGFKSVTLRVRVIEQVGEIRKRTVDRRKIGGLYLGWSMSDASIIEACVAYVAGLKRIP